MKNHHLIAFSCLVVAFICYGIGLSSQVAAGFTLLGSLFELVAWKNMFKALKK